jgi:exosome complex RNA-binding protein Csl4
MTHNVRCPACGLWTNRKVRDDMLRDDALGRYGACSRCGTLLERQRRQAGKQAEKAKADLRGMGLEA